jgi:LysM repeat protein
MLERSTSVLRFRSEQMPTAVVPQPPHSVSRQPGTTTIGSGSSPARFMREPWPICEAPPALQRPLKRRLWCAALAGTGLRSHTCNPEVLGRAMFRLGIFRTALIVGCGLVAACAERSPPVAPAAPPAATKQIYVVVERGQSLDQIAQTYRVGKDDIIAANQLKPPYRLKLGTVLAIPVAVTETVEPAALRSTPDTPPRAVAKPDTSLRATVRPDRATSAPAPVRRAKPKAMGQAVISLDDPEPAQRGTRKPSSSDPEVISLDDPAPARGGTSNSSTPPAGASSDAASPRISIPGSALEP